MSKKAILEIKKAEDQAAATRRIAAEKAAAMREAVEKQGAAHCDEVIRATEEEYGARLAEIREKASELIAQKREDAVAEAEALTAAAEEHMQAAVEAIVWGIVEKCQ